MAFETTKDVLDHARKFHKQLAEFYGQLSLKAEKQRIKILLDYMSQQEKYLEETMVRYEEGLTGKIRNTWFQYPPPKEVLESCRKIGINDSGDLTVDDVIEMAINLDQCLIDLYKDMIKNAETDQMREVFTSLLDMENRQKLELVRNAQEWKDL